MISEVDSCNIRSLKSPQVRLPFSVMGEVKRVARPDSRLKYPYAGEEKAYVKGRIIVISGQSGPDISDLYA